MNKYIHYTFSTYKRAQILVGGLVEEMKEIFVNICEEKGLIMVCQNILVDHVHMIINKKLSDRNEYIMKMIKGGSAYHLFKKYKVNRLEFRKLWSRGYRAYELSGEDDLQRAINYVLNQKIDGVDKRVKEAATFSRRLPN